MAPARKSRDTISPRVVVSNCVQVIAFVLPVAEYGGAMRPPMTGVIRAFRLRLRASGFGDGSAALQPCLAAPAANRSYNSPMPVQEIEDAIRRTTMYKRLSENDRQHLARVSRLKVYAKGDRIFGEGDPSEFFSVVVSGRVKIVKMTPAGKDVILEIFATGDPFGAVAAYEGRPFPASAIALEDTVCLLTPRVEFFSLLEQHPSLVRGLLLGLTQRLVELTNRLTEMTGGRVEARFARLFLKLADNIGRPSPEGTMIPMPLSRQELADLTGTTIETCIRIMSRWGKDEIVRTEKDSFVLIDKDALETLAGS
ncbi:MAG: Crp/Fnr family transcriptional regulator [Acidobacteria bacterium]|nr:MAG: Crp/Fnr family transcriptional regulator [Acidobacteriota bacterium]